MNLSSDVGITLSQCFPEKWCQKGLEVSEHFVYTVNLFFIALSYTCKLFIT